jgi:hypothetical protein
MAARLNSAVLASARLPSRHGAQLYDKTFSNHAARTPIYWQHYELRLDVDRSLIRSRNVYATSEGPETGPL